MGSLPGWAKWLVIGAGVLLSPVFAFLFALSLAVLVVVIKAAGVPASLAIGATSVVACVLVRRLRGPPRDQFGDT